MTVITQQIQDRSEVVVVLRASPWRLVLSPGQADWLAEQLRGEADAREALARELVDAADRCRYRPDTRIELADPPAGPVGDQAVS